MKISELKPGCVYKCVRFTSERFDDIFYGKYISGNNFMVSEDSYSGQNIKQIPLQEIRFWTFLKIKYED